jgi:hypothetical protein
MKPNTLLNWLAAGLLLAAGSAHAAHYHVSIDIDPTLYTSNPNAPFLLDFQLNSGGGASPASNSATVRYFSFTGGSATGTANASGDASGNLGSVVTLADSAANPFNELFQGFSSGTTAISFDVYTTANVNADAPDWFSVAILDSSAGNPQVPTNAPDGVSLVTLSLGPEEGLAYAGIGSASGINASVVPTPATLGLLASGWAGWRAAGRRRSA